MEKLKKTVTLVAKGYGILTVALWFFIGTGVAAGWAAEGLGVAGIVQTSFEGAVANWKRCFFG